MADIAQRAVDRGQLLIISSLLLALLLVLLTLTVHSAVVSEVHVSQTTDNLRDERGAIQYQDAVRRGVKGQLSIINQRSTEYDELRTSLYQSIANWSNLVGPAYAREAIVTNASLNTVAFETSIEQNDSGNFTDLSGSTNWPLAENVSSVRSYHMNASTSNLIQTDDCLTNQGCFTVHVKGQNDTWQMFVHSTENSSLVITVINPNDTKECTTSASNVRINLTSGNFDDGMINCTFPTFKDTGSISPPYNLTYKNANNITGTYRLIVTGRIVNGTIDDDARYDTSATPRLDPRIVRASVGVRYRISGLDYRSNISISNMGEP